MRKNSIRCSLGYMRGQIVIIQRVVEACGLKSIRPGLIQGVHGMQSEAYVINLSLPDKITFDELTIVKAMRLEYGGMC